MMQAIMQDMQVRSQLLPLLRTPLLGEMVAWLYLHPEQSFSMTELARRFASSQSTISRESDQLVASGLLLQERHGNLRLVRANTDSVLARPLTELLALTYGPLAVLADVFASVAGVDAVYIYGSWAARYLGEAGPVPRDIDVLVVGSADEDDIFDAAHAAERRLGREVNTRSVTPRAWHRHGGDPLLAAIRSRPLVAVDLEGSVDEMAARADDD
jgi:predicted nucleotidyltransferase